MPVVMQKKLCISNEHVDEWFPKVKLVQGREFLELEKWDRKFVVFCTGTTLRFGAKRGYRTIDWDLFDKILKLRSDASQAAFERAVRSEAQRKKKVRRCKPSDRSIAGDIVDIEVGGTQVAVLHGCKSASLWVEATQASIDAVVDVMKDAGVISEKKKRRRQSRDSYTEDAADDTPDASDQDGA